MAVQVATSKVAEILEQIAALPDDRRLILHGKTWDEYQELLDELGEHRRVLVSFAEGVLEIMPLSYRHERYKEVIARLINVLADELELVMEPAGSTTLQLEVIARGAEPDTSFFIQHAAQMIGQETHDLSVDPPPDLVVEIDIYHPSYSKEEIYARFGVPEFWSYDGQRFTMRRLVDEVYIETESSLAFPFLKADELLAFIEESKTHGLSGAARSFRAWVQAHRPTQ